ncbi:MAG: molybdate ABC transporter substrate-binding protein [Candidatus Acidiferrales bacterium]
MKRTLALLWLVLAAMLLGHPAVIPALARNSVPASAAEVTVSAAISLKDALDEIGQKYEGIHPGAKVVFNYGGSGTLRSQIEQGAPVDVFVSASEKDMDALNAKGLVRPDTRRDIVANTLVLIVPADHDPGIHDFADLAGAQVKSVAVGEPTTVPAGMYAQQAFAALGITAAVHGKLVLAKDVRQALTFVATGNADAGVVYSTDARITSKVRVVATAPASSHDPIVYPLAVLKSAHDSAAALAVVGYFAADDAKVIFQKYGFTIPPQ